jgi:predicted phosphodiesterase
METKSTFLDRFLFNGKRRILPYYLLAMVFGLGIGVTSFVVYHADEIIFTPTKEILTDAAVFHHTDDQTGNVATNQTPTKQSSGTKKKTTGLAANEAGTSSTPDTTSSLTETLSAYVAFYADNQSDTDGEDAVHQAVVNRILATNANPIFHGGDLMENGTADSLNRFNNIAASMLSARTFYGALGNNDRNGADTATPSPLYLANFSFPNNERWYSVNSGNLHMVILDSAFAASDPTQLSWLASDLQSAASQSRITGVIFHHPTFSAAIESYLVNYGVDFVVAGHIHSYTKTVSNGISMFTLTGGPSLGYATASIYSSYGQFKVYDTAGNLIESSRFNNR